MPQDETESDRKHLETAGQIIANSDFDVKLLTDRFECRFLPEHAATFIGAILNHSRAWPVPME